MSTAPQTVRPALSALADDTRWAILVRLAERPASASTLAGELPVSRQAVAKHLAVLQAAGLVRSERRGRQVVHTVVGSRLSRLAHDLDVIGRAWDDRLARVKQLAEGGAEASASVTS